MRNPLLIRTLFKIERMLVTVFGKALKAFDRFFGSNKAAGKNQKIFNLNA